MAVSAMVVDTLLVSPLLPRPLQTLAHYPCLKISSFVHEETPSPHIRTSYQSHQPV